MEMKLKVLNEEGLHARPAGILVKAASKYMSEIQLLSDDDTANAKSIMSIMGLGLVKDSEVTLTAQGSDAAEAMSEITALFNNKFHL